MVLEASDACSEKMRMDLSGSLPCVKCVGCEKRTACLTTQNDHGVRKSNKKDVFYIVLAVNIAITSVYTNELLT